MKARVAVPAHGGACSIIFAASPFRSRASAPSLNVQFKLIHDAESGIVDERRLRRWPIPGFGRDRVITPFDKIRTDDTELSEDFSFCHRWTQGCGGKIDAAVSHKVPHEGRLVVDAACSDPA